MNDEFALPNGSFSVSDIQDSFEYIIEKHDTVADKPTTRIYANRIKNRIIFEIKAEYYFEFLPIYASFRVKELFSVHYNIVNNDYHYHSSFLYRFVLNKSFGQLL